MSLSEDWSSLAILFTVGVGVVILAYVLMQMIREKRNKHRHPVRNRKRGCPVCGENSLVRQTPAAPLWMVAWYRCNICKQDFWRYRWNGLLRRPQI